MDKIEELSEITDEMAFTQRWIREIELASKEWKEFHKRAKSVYKRYIVEKNNSEISESRKRLNLLWSNTETIKPALYNQTPKPEVARRNNDKDPIGRVASDILERDLKYCLESYDFDGKMEECVHDYTLLNFAQARVEYDPLIEDEELKAEYAKISYVHWNDFLMNSARSYDEVRFHAFRHFFTRDELKKLSPKHGTKVPLDHTPDEMKADDSKPGDDLFKKAIVWEIWDKSSEQVIFINTSYPDAPLKVTEPFCKFKDFFCAPKPMIGLRGDKLMPVPEYVQYQDQAKIVDDLTDKIYTLTKAIKLAGVYNGKVESLQKLVEDGGNILVPVSDWTSFAQNGSMQGNISFLPLSEVAAALLSAYDARERAKADIYESTGISDIVRGSSNPNETATAQAIKNQWGSLRIRKRQKDVQRFARDLMRLKAEIIAECFSPENIIEMSGIQLLTDMDKQQAIAAVQQGLRQMTPDLEEQLKEPSVEQVIDLLQNDRLRSFSVKIETDSTMQSDQTEEQANRNELIASISSFLGNALPVVQSAPETAAMFGAMLTFAVRAYNVGSELETVIEDTMDKITQKANQPPQPPQPEPKDILKAETDKGKMQVDMKKAQMDYEVKKEENQIKAAELISEKQQRAMEVNYEESMGRGIY